MDTVKFLLYFSDFIVPFTMFYIVIYGFFNRNDVYESFLKGVKEGFQIVIEIAPTMIALLVSIGIFRASGALDSLSELLAPAGKLLHIPEYFLHRQRSALSSIFLKNMVRIQGLE